MAGCIIFFVLLQFFVLPAVSSWREDSAKADEIQPKLIEMRRLVQSRPIIQLQIEAAHQSIGTMAANIPLPILGNYLLNMEKHIRVCASNVGVNVVNITDNDVLDIGPANSKFKVYRIRVQTRSGFSDLVQLAESIHRSNPLVSFSGMNIVARDDDPMSHEVSIVVAWLVWAEPAKRPAFLMEESGSWEKR